VSAPFATVTGGDLLESPLARSDQPERQRHGKLKRQGGWQRWEQVERYSHTVPVQDRRAMPNPLALQKTAFGRSLPRGSAAFPSSAENATSHSARRH
jgi:hypothetical protein